jgi:hypothetical protein
MPKQCSPLPRLALTLIGDLSGFLRQVAGYGRQFLSVDVSFSNGQKVLCTSVIFRNAGMGNKMGELHLTSLDRRNNPVGRDACSGITNPPPCESAAK